MYIGRQKKGLAGGNAPSAKIKSKLDAGGSFSFPNDLGVHQFCMIFHEYNYNMEASQVKESVVLPLPMTIVDKYGMEYNSADLKTMGAAGATAGNDIIDSYKKAGSAAGKEKEAQRAGSINIDGLAADVGTGVMAIARDLNPFASQVEPALALSTGTISNPHTALLFSAVKLKVFDFTWKLYPQTLDESNNLKKIIKLIKQRSHPSFMGQGTNNYVMKYPHEVDLYYLGQGDSMHRFKRAAITSMQVNYTPEGQPAFFAGTGQPVFTELQLGFTETTVWTSEDFEDEPDATGSGEL